MIRRGFWLVTGAVLGVTGYRKASRLARGMIGQPQPRSLASARHAAGPPRDLRGLSGFAKDVRDGMAEYWDLHHGELDRTLGYRRSPGGSLQGRREH